MRRGVLALATVAVALAAVAWLAGGHSGPRQPIRPAHAAHPRQVASPAMVATRFLTGLTLPVVESRRRRDAYLGRFAAPDHLSQLRSQYAGEAQRVVPSFAAKPRASWIGLIGHREQQVDADHVRVDVWAVSAGAAGHAPVAVGWQLLRVTVVRTRDDWKVATVAQRPAPDLRGDGSTLAAATAGFKEYRVAP